MPSRLMPRDDQAIDRSARIGPLRSPRLRRSLRAALASALIAIGLPVMASTPAAAAPTDFPAVVINKTTSAGFVHPGIAVSADSLINARTQVLAGTEPWASYYKAMVATKYASTTFASANQGSTPGTPAVATFNSQSVEARFIDDAFRAYTQAIQYVITGDPVHRENALKIMRIWSQMDPDGYAVYPDARIHSGTPLMRMTAAAEILRYSSVNAGSDGYDLDWTAKDTTDFTNNLVVPVAKVFNSSNTNFMGQHSYSLIGAIASYIFTDDTVQYRRAVEWFSVNASNPDDTTNGALTKVMPKITKNDPLNHTGRAFVQLNEMGRDQAHAWDDVTMLTQIARVIDVQGTRLDPKAGTVSTKANAVSTWAFADDRLLRGAEQFFAFMMGKDIPYVDVTGRGGTLAQAYRGRIFEPTDELYRIYKYELGVDVDKIAPSVAELATHQDDGPTFYWGTSAYNFWNSNPDFNPDYWLSFPSDLPQQAPPSQSNALVQAESRTVTLTGKTAVRSSGDTGYLRVRPRPAGTTIGVRTLVQDSRSDYAPYGVLIRTNGTATMQVRAGRALQPFYTLTLPDTHGQWRYITYDMSTSVLRGSTGGAYLAYYTFSGSRDVAVDVDAVNLQAGSQLTPPTFARGSDTTLIAVAKEPFSADLSATDKGTEPIRYSVGTQLPTGTSLDPTSGTLTWKPRKATRRATFVVADDGTTDTVLRVKLIAAANRKDAIDAALDGYNSTADYVAATRTAVEDANTAATAHIGSADSTTFAADLAAIQTAVANLQLVTPRLASDGSIDYYQLASSTALSDVAIGNILDDDTNSFSGDLKAPFVLDFGAGFRVQADAFGLQARYNFANRSQGANVYGSNDGRTWTLLTSRETTDTSDDNFAMEQIPVRPEVGGKAFRFVKVQVDDPGPATDPAYPGLSSFGEVHIYGQRLEMSQALRTVSIASDASDPTTAQNGDTITLTMIANQPIDELTAAGGLTSVDGPAVADGPLWLRIERAGLSFSVAVASDGIAWTELGSGMVDAFGDAPYFAGLVVTSGEPTRLSTAVFDQIAVLS